MEDADSRRSRGGVDDSCGADLAVEASYQLALFAPCRYLRLGEAFVTTQGKEFERAGMLGSTASSDRSTRARWI